MPGKAGRSGSDFLDAVADNAGSLDAASDFERARRQQKVSSLAARMRGKDAEDRRALSFQDVVAALGVDSEVSLGIHAIPVERIVGSVDKVRDFDPKFRPRTGRSRERWERIAKAARRGEPLPPIDVYQIGDMYFVRDGHHRVSVFRSLALPMIDADVRLVGTLVEPDNVRAHSDLSDRELRKVMIQRVPLPKPARKSLQLTDAQQYPWLAEMVEAWGARMMYSEATLMDRRHAAVRWYDEEYTLVSKLIEDRGLRAKGETPADAFLRFSAERYAAYRRHVAWTPEVIETLSHR